MTVAQRRCFEHESPNERIAVPCKECEGKIILCLEARGRCSVVFLLVITCALQRVLMKQTHL